MTTLLIDRTNQPFKLSAYPWHWIPGQMTWNYHPTSLFFYVFEICIDVLFCPPLLTQALISLPGGTRNLLGKAGRLLNNQCLQLVLTGVWLTILTASMFGREVKVPRRSGKPETVSVFTETGWRDWMRHW